MEEILLIAIAAYLVVTSRKLLPNFAIFPWATPSTLASSSMEMGLFEARRRNVSVSRILEKFLMFRLAAGNKIKTSIKFAMTSTLYITDFMIYDRIKKPASRQRSCNPKPELHRDRLRERERDRDGEDAGEGVGVGEGEGEGETHTHTHH